MFSTYKWLWFLLLVSLGGVTPTWCQYVTITGTIVDQNGCPYVNGTGSAVLVPSNVQYYFGNNPATNIRPTWQLDSFGHFSMQLYETDLLTPVNPAPQWQFRFNSAQVVSPVAVGSINFTMTPMSLTTSQDISAIATPQSAPIPPGCGQPSGGPAFNCNNPTVGANVFSTGIAVPGLACDPLVIDTNGTLTALQFNAINPWNGELWLTAKGTGPPTAPPSSTTTWTAPSVIPTSYRNVMPPAPCTPGQGLGVQTITTDGTGTTNENWNCATFSSSGGGVELQTNGIDNLNCVSHVCPLQNLLAGSNITLSNTSGGNVQISSSASGFTLLSNPIAPTVTPLGTAGSTTYCYEIVGNENGATSTTAHSAATTTGCTSTGNATLTSTGCPTACTAANQLSAYADTLYGYRCVDVYRTSGGGSTGKIATCVDKTYIDTGGAGDTTTPPPTNTTQAIVTMNPTSGGCNYPPGSPQGVDGLPCTPNALDAEFTPTNGIADANDPWWFWIHQSTALAILTNGMVSLQQANAGSNVLSCLGHTVPAAPYRITTLVYPAQTANASAAQPTSIGFYESATGKFVTTDILTSFAETQSHWTNSTTYGSTVNGPGPSPNLSGPVNIQWGRDGSNNISFWHSQDGVNYVKDYTETTTAFFTTAPDTYVICINAHNTTTSTLIVDYDYVRVKNLAPGVNF